MAHYESLAGGSGAGAGAGGLVQGAADFEISVKNPTKVGDGYGSYVAYQIHTKTSSAQYKRASSTVSRRYTDFVWLHEQITSQHPVFFVPVLPEKSNSTALKGQISGNFDAAFLEQRRNALERFLQRLVRHPHIRNNDSLQVFLEYSDSEFANTRASSAKIQKPSYVGGFFSNLFGGAGSTGKSDHSDDGSSDLKAYFTGIEEQLMTTQRFVRQLSAGRRGVGASTRELGLALLVFQTMEEDGNKVGTVAGALTKQLRTVGEAAESTATALCHQADAETAEFSEFLEDYLRLLQGIKEAFKGKSLMIDNHRHAKVTTDKKVEAKAKLEAQGGGADALQTLQAEIDASKQRVEECRVALENADKTLDDEVQRFHKEKIADWCEALARFAHTQAEYGARTITPWTEALVAMGGAPPSVVRRRSSAGGVTSARGADNAESAAAAAPTEDVDSLLPSVPTHMPLVDNDLAA